MKKILDHIFITRPILFFPGWTTLLLGYLEASENLSLFYGIIPFQNIIFALISFALAMGGTFILNQLADAETDEVNEKCFFIGKNMISRKQAFAQASIMLVISLILSHLINISFLIGIVLFIILTGYLYNFIPFKLKDKAFFGLLSNVMMGWLAFYLGWVLLQPFSYLFWIKSISFGLLNATLCIFTTLPDVEGDEATNKQTIGVKLGVGKSVYIAVVIFIIGFLWGVFIQDNLVIAIYVGSVFHFVRVLLHPQVKEVLATTKWTLFLYSIVAALFFPWYVILIILGYYLTRWYYKRRFDLDYPSFSKK